MDRQAAVATAAIDVATTDRNGHHVVDLVALEAQTTAAAGAVIAPRPGGLLAATATQLAFKRAIDVVGSACCLMLLSWLFVLVAAAVRLSSRGPAIFVQERVGRDGTTFRLYKFRTMYREADADKRALADRNECSGPVFKMRADPRITPVGQILRRFSIDELPQFLNVLRGDMSLVGPRPPLPEEVEHYDAHERRRLTVRPGLTCIWQVSGRSTIDWEDWVAMDVDYIERWSLGMDLRLLLLTVPAVITGRGAY